MINFLFVNDSGELSKTGKIALYIPLLLLIIVGYRYCNYIDSSIVNTRIDSIVSKYLLCMELEGYLNEANQQKLDEELKSIGVVNISLEETTKQKTENGTVTLKVKADYKNKEINKKKISTYYLLD